MQESKSRFHSAFNPKRSPLQPSEGSWNAERFSVEQLKTEGFQRGAALHWTRHLHFEQFMGSSRNHDHPGFSNFSPRAPQGVPAEPVENSRTLNLPQDPGGTFRNVNKGGVYFPPSSLHARRLTAAGCCLVFAAREGGTRAPRKEKARASQRTCAPKHTHTRLHTATHGYTRPRAHGEKQRDPSAARTRTRSNFLFGVHPADAPP